MIKYLQSYLPYFYHNQFKNSIIRTLGPKKPVWSLGFFVHKVAKVVIICKNKNFLFTTFEIISSCFKNLGNNQKLIVINFISNFYKNYFPKKKGYWMLLTQISLSNYLIRINFKNQSI